MLRSVLLASFIVVFVSRLRQLSLVLAGVLDRLHALFQHFLVHVELTARVFRRLVLFGLLALLLLVVFAQFCDNVIDGLRISFFWEALDGSQRRFFQVHLVIFAAKHALVVH